MSIDSVGLVSELESWFDLDGDSTSEILVIGEERSGLVDALSDRPGSAVITADPSAVAELEDESQDLVIYASPKEWTAGELASGLAEQLRRVARKGVLIHGSSPAEVEQFFETRGDLVQVLGDRRLVLALKADSLAGNGSPSQPADRGRIDDPDLLDVCLAQTGALAEGGRRLDAAREETNDLRRRLERAETEVHELSAMVAEALNALAAERREHDATRRRFEVVRRSRAWPALVIAYNVARRLRTLRARVARRGRSAHERGYV